MSDQQMTDGSSTHPILLSSPPRVYQNGHQPEAGPSRPRADSGSPIPYDLLDFELEQHPNTRPSPPPDDDVRDDPNSTTGYVYDVRMTLHAEVDAHKDPDPEKRHPERAARITGIHKALVDGGCIRRMKKIPIRQVTREEIIRVHTLEHWERVEQIEFSSPEHIALTLDYYNHHSLYINSSTSLCARLSAGGVIETALAAMDPTNNVRNAFAIVRPPGHHAEPTMHMGFCFFNNISVAARAVQEQYGKIRMVIIDWDVHHGNGTQKAFYEDPSVLYISIHRYDSGVFYPGSAYGSNQACGEGAGVGRNVNIGWERGGKGDADYLYAFQKIVMPICYEFAPELVLVSAGFDAARGDPLGGCDVTPAGYGHMLHMLKGLAGGRVVVALEGGYDIDAISVSALACAEVLLGDPPAMLPPLQASDSATQTIHEVALVQSRHWTSISPKATEPRDSYRGEDEDVTFDVADMLAAHRNDHLYKCYRLCGFPIVVPELERLYRDHVQSSENIYRAETVVLFVHDLATLKLNGYDSEHVNVRDELSYIVDTTNQILDWVLSDNELTGLGRGHHVGVIDVNLPSHFPTSVDPHSQNPPKTPADIKKSYLQLLEYIWDNMLDLRPDTKNVILIGHGTGCEALMSLAPKRAIENKVKAFVQVHGMNQPVKMLDSSKRAWFQQTAWSITPANHPVYGEAKKKNYGPLHFSPQTEPLLVLKSALPLIKAFIESKLYPDAPLAVAAALDHLPAQMAEASL